MEDLIKLILLVFIGLANLILTFLFYRWVIRFTLKKADRRPLTTARFFGIGIGLSLLFVLCTGVLGFVLLVLSWGSNSAAGLVEPLIYMMLSGVIVIWLALSYRRYWGIWFNDKINEYFKRKTKRNDDDPGYW